MESSSRVGSKSDVDVCLDGAGEIIKGSSKRYGRQTQKKLSDQIRSAWGRRTGLLGRLAGGNKNV